MFTLRSGILGTVVIGLMSGGNAAAGVGGGVDTSEGSEVRQDGSVSQSRELSSGREQASTVERNLLPFIVSGIQPLALHTEGLSFTGCQIVKGQLDREAVEQQLTEDLGEIPTDPTASPAAWLMHGDEREIMASCTAWGALSVFQPRQGWPFRPTKTDESVVLEWVQTRLAVGVATADMLAVVAQELSEMNGLTPDEYREAAAAAWRDHASLWLDSFEAAISAAHEASYSIAGASTPQPIEFRTDNGYHYAHGPDGAAISHYGLVLVGDGHIQGERYTASVSVGNEARMVRQSSDSSTHSTSTGESGGGRAATE